MLTQCKSRSYYRFSPPPASTYEQLRASALNNVDYQNAAIDSLIPNATTPENLESGQDGDSLYSLHESPGSQKKVSTSSKKSFLISSSHKEQPKNDAWANPNQDDLKPNALAHVTFFSAIGLILFYVFLLLPFSSPIGVILGLSMAIISLATGIISLPQIKKYHEMGKHLAIFGISAGGLAFILAILALIQISKAPPIWP
ncbi:MAG: DUF4190 domain-containing protein [Imperialibacter sp.]|uniref:DUF4190 domain-containing protein n=1 Tax=Imperialibacter sp. TaxID=2038411 RepID=UPI003A844637